jgi:CyaY protein
LDDHAFEALADAELNALHAALTRALEAPQPEASDLDVEVDLQMGILDIEFSDGTKYVINSHRAAKQIWMAADRNAWHFDPETEVAGTRWFASKTKSELWPTIELVVSRKLGRTIKLVNPLLDDDQVTSKKSSVRLKR